MMLDALSLGPAMFKLDCYQASRNPSPRAHYSDDFNGGTTHMLRMMLPRQLRLGSVIYYCRHAVNVVYCFIQNYLVIVGSVIMKDSPES